MGKGERMAWWEGSEDVALFLAEGTGGKGKWLASRGTNENGFPPVCVGSCELSSFVQGSGNLPFGCRMPAGRGEGSGEVGMLRGQGPGHPACRSVSCDGTVASIRIVRPA